MIDHGLRMLAGKHRRFLHWLVIVSLMLGPVGPAQALPARKVQDAYAVQELDCGDAPDSYQTLLNSNGACHILSAPLWMGATVDGEPDGQPSPLADADDLNPPPGPDDEDGVTLLTSLLAGSPAQILVTLGAMPGMLDAWIDFNRNNAFDHPLEHLWGASMPVNPGQNVLPFAVPAGAAPGTTYARFRISSNGGLPPFGLAPDGEVEDYTVVIEVEPEPMDYGDAPNTYKTLLLSNGARHMVNPNIYLGQLVDVELDGMPSPQADGDDVNPPGLNDEDAILSWPAYSPGDVGAPIAIDGGPSGGLLDAWIDFDGNGAFDHPAEHLWNAVSQALVPGPQIILFNVPATAVPGWTYARFRLSLAGGLSPTGAAPEGEVEDHRTQISPVIYDLTVQVSPAGGGTTTPPVGTHPYISGSVVSVSAAPATGYGLTGWSGACSGTGPCQVTMDADKTVTANFARLLGDVNLDGLVNSTDALIVLTADAGLPATAFCPLNYGDVNGDGYVNSTDALIILTYDVGLPVGSFPLGQPVTEPVLVRQPPGCP